MRLWSLHPALLDTRGLVALWREGLLAQKVLLGKTKGYRHHPQLQRFRQCEEPVLAIAGYLWAVHDEAARRGYSFDDSRIVGERRPQSLAVRRGQLVFEWEHLKKKVCQRDPAHYRAMRKRRRIRPHPLFTVVPGGIEDWERVG
jgi:hypothetical protein